MIKAGITVLAIINIALIFFIALYTFVDFGKKSGMQHLHRSRVNRAINMISYRTNVPIYYINLDRSPERKLVTESFFRSNDLRRVPAVDGNHSNFTDYFPPNTVENPQAADYGEYLHALKGEYAVMLSHFKAIKMAYDDGQEHALIIEDDLTNILSPFWLKSLDDVVSETNKTDSNWNVLWLQYLSATNGAMMVSRKAWAANVTNYVHHKNIHIYGAAAYVVSRRGMKTILDKYYDYERDKFDCMKRPKGVRCVSDYLLPSVFKKGQLLTIPPMFVVTLVEDTTGVRQKSDKYRLKKFHYSKALDAFEFSLHTLRYRKLLEMEQLCRNDKLLNHSDENSETDNSNQRISCFLECENLNGDCLSSKNTIYNDDFPQDKSLAEVYSVASYNSVAS